MNNTIIEIKNLSKTFKNFQVWDNLNLSISKGKIHVLLGENGAGKTTLIKAIINLLHIDNGEILINGINHKDFLKQDKINYMPEKIDLDFADSIQKCITLYAILNNYSSKDAKKIATDILNVTNLISKKKKSFKSLSSGQKQIILMNLILIAKSKSKIMILDEPAANLDPNQRIILFDKLRTLNKEGYTILLSTHIIAEAKGFADEATLLHNKKIVFNGDISDKDLGQIWADYTLKDQKGN